MKTPICDFVKEYCNRDAIRLHMPGHKGKSLLGYEGRDITEIDGADSLFEASGIIAESEKNASTLFGADTFYSTGGSSDCIRAMLYLVKLCGKNVKIFAVRNAHKAFLSASALLDLDVEWLYGETHHYLFGGINLSALEDALASAGEDTKAVYITSPDYLGNIADIKAISQICKRHNALLCVDNAHGAYLKFLPESLHPIDLGADICCDSAHKTLPVLTGGAYLHIAKSAPDIFKAQAKNALSLFGSTSPSYIILQSLDMANAYIYNGFKEKLCDFICEISKAKSILTSIGFKLCGSEALKIVISAKEYGYYGFELASELLKHNIVCEFYDRDFTVMMLTPENGKEDLDALTATLASIEKRQAVTEPTPSIPILTRAMTIREAVFARSEVISARESENRVLAQFNIACPPAVPIVVCGEIIDKHAIECFEYYGITEISVIK